MLMMYSKIMVIYGLTSPRPTQTVMIPLKYTSSKNIMADVVHIKNTYFHGGISQKHFTFHPKIKRKEEDNKEEENFCMPILGTYFLVGILFIHLFI